jgi:hypothetical protein
MLNIGGNFPEVLEAAVKLTVLEGEPVPHLFIRVFKAKQR